MKDPEIKEMPLADKYNKIPMFLPKFY